MGEPKSQSQLLERLNEIYARCTGCAYLRRGLRKMPYCSYYTSTGRERAGGSEIADCKSYYKIDWKGDTELKLNPEIRAKVHESIAAGQTNAEIAAACGLSTRSVEMARRHMNGTLTTPKQVKQPKPPPASPEEPPPVEKGRSAAMLMMLELAAQMLTDMGAEVDTVAACGMDTAKVTGTRADATVELTLKLTPIKE